MDNLELTVEVRGISTRINDLEAKMGTLIELKNRDYDQSAQRHEDNLAILNRINSTLYGNGKPGLVQDLSEIKHMVQMAGWVVSVGGAMVIVQVAQFFLNLFRKGGV